MRQIIDGMKSRFHRDIVSNPETHGWVLNLYLSGERYPQKVCDYFQADFAPLPYLADALRRHAADEDKHVKLYTHALQTMGQPVLDLQGGDVFNEVIKSFTPGTFHIVEADPPETRRWKMANFLAHAYHLEKRIARSFEYHIDACGSEGRGGIANIVAAVYRDEGRHIRYTRDGVRDLLPRREAQRVMDTHRRAEAKANLSFSAKQVRTFLRQFPGATSKRRRLLYHVCAGLMEGAGHLV